MQISQSINPFAPPVADQPVAGASVSTDAEAFADILVEPVSEERGAGIAEQSNAEPVVGNAISLQLLAEFPTNLICAAVWPVSSLPDVEGALANTAGVAEGTVNAPTAVADQPLPLTAERIGTSRDPMSPPKMPEDLLVERSTESLDVEQKEAASKLVAPRDAGEIAHLLGQRAGQPTTDGVPLAGDPRQVDKRVDGHSRGFALAPDDLAQGDKGPMAETRERSSAPSGSISPTIAPVEIAADANPVGDAPNSDPSSAKVSAQDFSPQVSAGLPDKPAVERPDRPAPGVGQPIDIPSPEQLTEKQMPVAENSAGIALVPSTPLRPETHSSQTALLYPVVFQGQIHGHSGELAIVVEAKPTFDPQPLVQVPEPGIQSELQDRSGERPIRESGRDAMGETTAKAVIPVSVLVEPTKGTPMERLWHLLETLHPIEDEVEQVLTGVVLGQASGHPTSGGLGPMQGPTLSPQVTQIAGQLVASLTRNASGAVEIALSPEELGRVTMRIEADQSNPDRMVIMMTFERPETLDLFRRHASDLDDAIRAAGLSGASIGFDRSGEDRPAAGNHHTDDIDVNTVEPLPNPAIRSLVPVTGSSLDLRL